MTKVEAKQMAKFKTLIILSTIVVGLIVGYSFSQSKYRGYCEKKVIMMDTFVTVKTYGTKKVASRALNAAFKELKSVEGFSSFTISSSELYKLNRQKTLKPSASFTALLNLSNKAYKMTDGYFDPSFSLLQKAYGFYDGKGRLPTPKELANLLTHVGFEKVLTQNDENVQLASSSLIDFGGIAGGFAIEKAINAIRLQGCKTFFIDDGGDIWIEGEKPDKQPWRIAVRDPRNQGQLALIETRDNVAISTSGDYERFVTVNGKKYGHIMNPKTGIPADHYRSVTVVASSPFLADIYSTTLFAMPPKLATKWANDRSIPVIIVTASNTVIVNDIGKIWYQKIIK